MINDKYTQQEIDFYNRVEAMIAEKINLLESNFTSQESVPDSMLVTFKQLYDDLGRCQALRAALVRIAKATVGVDNSSGTGV